MPDLASRSEARTSCVVLPMDETIPIPVTTTRLIAHSSIRSTPKAGFPARPKANGGGSQQVRGRLRSSRGAGGLEQADPQGPRLVDPAAVGLEPAVRDAEHELRPEH